jgi:hypothetical protein
MSSPLSPKRKIFSTSKNPILLDYGLIILRGRIII